MSILDTIAPRYGRKQRRIGIAFLFKAIFYLGIPSYAIFVTVTFLMLDKDTELEIIPATQTESVVFEKVLDYLKATDVRSIYERDIAVNCWDVFEDAEFTVEYLNLKSWQISAYYNRVRYYWRVHDLTLKVTRDIWFRTTNRTIKC